MNIRLAPVSTPSTPSLIHSDCRSLRRDEHGLCREVSKYARNVVSTAVTIDISFPLLEVERSCELSVMELGGYTPYAIPSRPLVSVVHVLCDISRARHYVPILDNLRPHVHPSQSLRPHVRLWRGAGCAAGFAVPVSGPPLRAISILRASSSALSLLGFRSIAGDSGKPFVRTDDADTVPFKSIQPVTRHRGPKWSNFGPLTAFSRYLGGGCDMLGEDLGGGYELRDGLGRRPRSCSRVV